MPTCEDFKRNLVATMKSKLNQEAFMGLLTPLSTDSLSIGNIYSQTRQQISESLRKLASGLKVGGPADDLGGYTHAMNLRTSYDSYENINQAITGWQGALSTAQTATTAVSKDLQRMNELINLSQQSSDNAQKDGYQAEFMQKAAEVQSLRNNTTYGSVYLLNTTSNPAGTIYLTPGSTANKMDLTLNPAVSDAHLASLNSATTIEIGSTHADYATAADAYAAARTAVSAAQTDLNTFSSTVSGYSGQLNSFANINSTIIANQKSAESSILEVDQADELATYTALDIRSQSALALLAQSNLSARNVLVLYGLKGQ
jgi:flagellin